MDRLTLSVAVDASWLETESFDEEIMRRRDVLVYQKWDDTLELAHRFFLSEYSAERCWAVAHRVCDAGIHSRRNPASPARNCWAEIQACPGSLGSLCRSPRNSKSRIAE